MSVGLQEKRFPSATGVCDIVYRCYMPQEIRGAVVLVHGMAEHIARYDAFARFLAENGLYVAGFDLPSHGKSYREGMPRGFFGKEKGWENILLDIRAMGKLVKGENPSVPLILFGHSMGSLLTAEFMSRYGEDFDAYVMSGTSGPNFAAPIGAYIAKREIKKGKGMEPSEKLDKLCFGGFSKKVPHAQTAFDWLTRDPAVVEAYSNDPLCGFPFTPYGYLDMLEAMQRIASAPWAQKVPNKPVLLISGDKDPVGQMGKGVKKVYGYLKHSGHKKAAMKLYPGARHELLNENNREEVYNDVLLFIEAVAAEGEFA